MLLKISDEKPVPVFAYGAFTLCGQAFQPVRLTKIQVVCFSDCSMSLSYNPRHKNVRFGLFPVRSPLLRESSYAANSLITSIDEIATHAYFFLFLRLLRCFTSPGLLLIPYIFRYGCMKINSCGFPHSDIFGS